MKYLNLKDAALVAALFLSSCSTFSERHERALETLTPITESTDEKLSETLEGILLEVERRQAALEDENTTSKIEDTAEGVTEETDS